MKEIKAFIHRNRAADVVHALAEAGFRQLSVVDVKAVLGLLDDRRGEYSIEMGEKVVTDVKLEVICENDQKTAQAVNIIRDKARTGRKDSGWLYISEIGAAQRIEG